MEWNDETEVLLKLERISWAYGYFNNWGVSCIVDKTHRGPHNGKLTVVVTPDRTSFAVACESHLPLYMGTGWKLYD